MRRLLLGSGAASTTLDGGLAESAVRLGAGGVVRGFTITRGLGAPGGGIRALGPGAVTIGDNVIASNFCFGVDHLEGGPGGGIYIRTSGDMPLLGCAGSTVACNVFWMSGEPGCGILQPSNRVADPLFCDPNARSYELFADSRACPRTPVAAG